MSHAAKASLLLFFLTLCGAATFLTHYVREHKTAPAPRELFTVVNDQLTALRAEDYSSAYRHAASGVQQKFTLPQFETMVRRTYAGRCVSVDAASGLSDAYCLRKCDEGPGQIIGGFYLSTARYSPRRPHRSSGRAKRSDRAR